MSGDDVLKAVAVSRPPCGDCAAALADDGGEHGSVLLAVVPPPTQREQQERQAALAALRSALQRVRSQLELYESEHRAEAALMTTPSLTGFAGYWRNRLFNEEIPPPTIWTNAYGACLRVDSDLPAGDIRAATTDLMRARLHLVAALRRYASWKDDIEAAGTKAQVAIGVVALATVAAVIAGPLVVEALAGGGADRRGHRPVRPGRGRHAGGVRGRAGSSGAGGGGGLLRLPGPVTRVHPAPRVRQPDGRRHSVTCRRGSGGNLEMRTRGLRTGATSVMSQRGRGLG
ncbi:hypothetical protein GCM10009616_28150 [Microlunatus lacustris]